MRNLKFWGKFWLEGMGMLIGVSLVIALFVGVQHGAEMGSTASDRFEVLLALYPWYLMLATVFIVFTLAFSAFQPYLSVLVGMNATRKGAVTGMLVCLAAMIAGTLALSAVIWTVMENDIAVSGRSLFAAACGCLFGAGGAAVLVSGIAFRWKRYGMIVMVIVMMIVGGAAGAAAALSGNITDKIINVSKIGGNLGGQTVPMVILAAGIGLYLLASAFTFLITRKMEVRV